MGSIPVGDSDSHFCHVDQFTFHISLLSLKFAIVIHLSLIIVNLFHAHIARAIERPISETALRINQIVGFITAPLRNGNRTEWSPSRSVITQVITKSDDRAAGVTRYGMTRSLITN